MTGTDPKPKPKIEPIKFEMNGNVLPFTPNNLKAGINYIETYLAQRPLMPMRDAVAFRAVQTLLRSAHTYLITPVSCPHQSPEKDQ